MHKAARLVGVLWILSVVLAGIVLIAAGMLRSGRGNMLVLFGAALPGALLFRWGQLERSSPESLPRPKAAMDWAARRLNRRMRKQLPIEDWRNTASVTPEVRLVLTALSGALCGRLLNPVLLNDIAPQYRDAVPAHWVRIEYKPKPPKGTKPRLKAT
jgi:hypothetical protein